MLLKWLVALTFLLIFFSLGSALFFLVKDPVGSKRTVKALTWRIAISLGLFIVLMIGFAMGWITPHQITAGH